MRRILSVVVLRRREMSSLKISVSNLKFHKKFHFSSVYFINILAYMLGKLFNDISRVKTWVVFFQSIFVIF